MTEFIFITAAILIFYTYLGYPIILFLVSMYIKKPVHRADIIPSVTIVIPVHNEENQIQAKIENCLEIDYPQELLTIIVASDNSTDDTEAIVENFNSEQIRFIELPFRGGKVMAQNRAVMHAESDILVFTDVAILTDPNCIKLIAQNFNDPSIGAVSCRDVVVGEAINSEGEGSYIRYDMMVRMYTSQINSLIGVTGGFYAVRSEIAKGGWNPAFPPDFYVALRTIKLGLRVIEDPRVKAYYKTASKDWEELRRKVRTLNRGMNAMFAFSNRGLLNPFKYGIVSFVLFSHKLLRWLTPFFIIAFFISNFLLLYDHTYAVGIFIPQIIILLAAIAAYLFEKLTTKNSAFKLIRYFFIANMALLKAWYEFFLGRKYVSWKPTKR